MKTKSQKPRNGFTLIELLVAMAITTVIITVLVSVTSMALDTWNRSRSEVRAARQAKAMIDTMAHDFESFVMRKGNPFEWLYAKRSLTDTGPGSDDNASPNASRLVFFSAATDRYDGGIGSGADEGGDVSTVCYELVYKDPIAGETDPDFMTFVLYRKLINPDITFDATLGTSYVNLANDNLFSKAEAASTSSDPLVATTAIDQETNFICENIYQFSVAFHVGVTTETGGIANVRLPIGNGANFTETFKVTGSGLQFDPTFTPPAGINTDNTKAIEAIKAGRLSSVELSLTVITDFGLKQMRNRTFGTDAAGIAAKAEFIAEHTYQYSKLVQVPGS